MNAQQQAQSRAFSFASPSEGIDDEIAYVERKLDDANDWHVRERLLGEFRALGQRRAIVRQLSAPDEEA